MTEAPDRLQKQRFELKYIVTESKAQAIRFFCENYLQLDSFGATQPGNSYPVHSLYLDSPCLKTYRDTINGNRNRYKLRLRYYETGEADQPVFTEIKRRHDNVIAKKRAKIKHHSILPIVNGQFPMASDLVKPTNENLQSASEFCRLLNSIGARPSTHVRYMREAWELENSNAVRITFDREVQSEKINDIVLNYNLKNPVLVFGKQVIIEIKFTNRFPLWLRELVQRFGLFRQSAAKYVDGLNKINEQQRLAV